MKKIMMLLALSVLGAAAAEPKTVKFDFATQPELAEATYKDVRNLEYMERSIAIPPVSGQNFQVEFKLAVTNIKTYGNIWVGVSNSKRKMQNAFVRFGKSDSGALLHFYSGVSFGKPVTAKPWKGLQKQDYIVRIEYNAGSMQIRYQISDGSGKQLHDTGFVTCRVPLNPDRISIRVNDNPDFGVSTINYNAEKQSVFARSLIGYEGNTPYMLEMEIKEVTLVF